jgi:protein-S-isoprenylcysteine O-methyltransferase Ste14
LKALETLIPPPLVTLIFAIGIYVMAQSPTPSKLRTAIAIILAAIALVIVLAGVLAFFRARTTVNPMRPIRASSLVTSGIYRFTRNPMYLGDAILLSAWAIYLGDVFMLICLPLLMEYLNQFQIRPEERQLAEKFGSAYQDYCAKVRRWI